MGDPVRRILSIVSLVATFGLGLAIPGTSGAEEAFFTRALTSDSVRFGTDEAGALGPLAVYAASSTEGSSSASEEFEQDPWEPFNEKMFAFNRQLDRFVIKPVATAWDFVLPDPVQRCLANALDNIDVVRRLTNNVLQGKFRGAGREVARFTINSTVGFAGIFDVAKNRLGIEQSDEDTGQTFGVYGAKAGPYMVLPFLPVLTVRDGFGLAFDTAMNPLTWILPFGATAGIHGTNLVNERSLNLDQFERVEETVIDLYGAVRNAYLQRREAAIRQ